MDEQLSRDVRWLKIYAVASTLAFLLLATAAFVPSPKRQHFGEIDVERINVVEKDGKYRMVISNKDRSIGPIAYAPIAPTFRSSVWSRGWTRSRSCPSPLRRRR